MPSFFRSPLFMLAASRVKEFVREPGAVFWTFGFPILITVALGVAFRTQGPPQTVVAVIAGPGAADVAAVVAKVPGLSPETLSAEDAARRLRAGTVLLSVEAGPPVVLRYDPTRPDTDAAARAIDDALQRRAGRRDPIAVTRQTAVMPGGRYIDWLVPGLLGMQLLSGGLWGSAWAIVNARQRRLLKRLAGTPMRRWHYLFSFRLVGLLFVPLQVIVLFTFARIAFGVHVQGSLLSLLLLALLGSWSFAGIGLLCASRAQNSETANGLINLVSLPMFVLSGVFFSSARFPDVLQPVIHLLPLTALNDALRAVVNDGAPLLAQGLPVLTLLVWGVVTSTIALRWFRWV